jgi:hypothetical protein
MNIGKVSVKEQKELGAITNAWSDISKGDFDTYSVDDYLAILKKDADTRKR